MLAGDERRRDTCIAGSNVRLSVAWVWGLVIPLPSSPPSCVLGDP